MELFGKAELSSGSFCCSRRSFQIWGCPEGSPAFGRLREVRMLWPELRNSAVRIRHLSLRCHHQLGAGTGTGMGCWGWFGGD